LHLQARAQAERQRRLRRGRGGGVEFVQRFAVLAARLEHVRLPDQRHAGVVAGRDGMGRGQGGRQRGGKNEGEGADHGGPDESIRHPNPARPAISYRIVTA